MQGARDRCIQLLPYCAVFFACAKGAGTPFNDGVIWRTGRCEWTCTDY